MPGMNEPTTIEEAKRPEAPGQKWIYRTTCRCPHCNSRWVHEVAAVRGEVSQDQDPRRLKLALLCGTCEAMRRCFAIIVPEGQHFLSGRAVQFWRDTDTSDAIRWIWAAPKDFAPRVERIGIYEGQDLADQKNAEISRIMDQGGRHYAGMTRATHDRLGLSWWPG